MIFTTTLASTEAESASGIAALGIDGKAFIIQLITWILVFLVLRHFVFRPIVNVLEKRRETIEDGVRLTNEMRTEKEKLEVEITRIQKEARKHADEVLANSQQQAGTILKEAEESAQKKIEMLLTEAQKKIEEETKRAQQTVEKEAVDLVIRATEVIAHEKITASKDKALIARALKGQS